MTSKRLFLKGMKEDLRHKVWMLALSLLGSFLTMPVVWLLRFNDVEMPSIKAQLANMTAQECAEVIQNSANAMAYVFKEILMLPAGLIAILGAVIVGLESFYFLQQKSMVDTYHSLPVSRMQLFGIKYINGLLIWLVPHIFCTVLTLVFSGVLLARVGAAGAIFGVILEAVKNTAVLAIAFLLVYHLMMLATMLTGNMLNTLVMAGILGGGAISVYGLALGFMSTFFRTYYPQFTGLYFATYTSPLAAPIVLLCSRWNQDIMDGTLSTTLTYLIIALILGVLAWFSYLKRPSERAGKGLELRWIAWPLRLFAGILGGMGGWLFMHYLVDSNNGRTPWSVFGALLVGILSYGVLDVIFSMDFKAFFRHRWSMGAAMVVMLLVCRGFQRDFIGYDRYLPDQGEIQMASIASSPYGYYSNYNVEQTLQRVVLTDAAQIHTFLERGIENRQGRLHIPEEMQVEEAYCGDMFATDTFCVRVVLDNGSSYCRKYPYFEWDQDVVLPLLCSEEYAEGVYRITEEQIESCTVIRLTSGVNNNDGIKEILDRKIIRELAEAYNQDLSEQPQTIILGQDRVLGQITMTIQQEYMVTWRLDLLESMTHTLEVMEKNGILIFNQPTEAEDVKSITFRVNGSKYWYRGDTAISPVERSIRGYFGVYPEKLPEALEHEGGPGTQSVGYTNLDGNLLPEAVQDGEWEAVSVYEQLAHDPQVYSFTITDPAEIEELLPLVQYNRMNHRVGVFVEGFVEDVSILDKSGTEWGVCLRSGTMPEKYIRRFLEEAGVQ